MLCSLTLDGFTFVNLVIRADASAEVGTGHVMRMMALAQAWVDRVRKTDVRGQGLDGVVRRKSNCVLFICAMLPEALEQRLIDEGFQVMRIAAEPGSEDDIYQTLGLAQSNSQSDQFTNQPIAESTNHPHWVVLDGYAFNLNYQRAIRAAGFKLLVVDDYNHLPEYECDILLNQNIGAEAYGYRVNDDACRLIGPRYALLRREFREAIQHSRATKSEERSTKNILVTMGGADTHNVTLKVIEALNLSEIKGLNVKIVVGAANLHLASLHKAIQSPESLISYDLVIQSTNMPSLMRWADFTITAVGSTCWELFAMGVPIMTVILAENQERISHYLQEHELAFCCGWYDRISVDELSVLLCDALRDDSKLKSRAKRGAQLVDASGASLVVEKLWTLD